jgi:hypothetical protein
MHRTLIALIFCLAGAARAADTPPALNEDMASFFAGHWNGAGAFGNGKKIEANVEFQRELDGQWLLYRHTDKAPNSYKALGLWGVDKATGTLVMTVSDNFGNARRFESGGWVDGKVEFVKVGAAGTRRERFIFERKSPTLFRMSYEWSADGSSWKLGDFLDFERD